jgi:hypothetical protein
MANIGEANAINVLLEHLLRQHRTVPAKVRDAAVFLAQRSQSTLDAGLTEEEVARRLKADP